MPNSVTTQVGFSYLTAGPNYQLSLPAEFEVFPELATPVSNGVGGREFVYLPPGHNTAIPETYPLVRTISDDQERAVEVYQWPYEPPQWFLHWPLTAGGLWTHLREEDGAEMADMTVQALSVIEGVGTPFLLLSPPLRPAVGAFPGFQETALYLAPAQAGWSISLLRPSFLSAGQMLTLPGIDPNLTMIRAGSSLGIEIQCVGTDLTELTDVTTTVLSSITEGDKAPRYRSHTSPSSQRH